MNSIVGYLPTLQMILAVLLILGVLLQRSEAALGSAFGDDSWSSVKHERRGAERVLFLGTVAVGILFIAAALASLILQ